MSIKNLVLVGCGKMGGAMLARWQACATAREVHVVSPRPPAATGITHHASAASLPPLAAEDAVVFAVKPALLETVLPHYKDTPALCLSVAAGKTLAFYRQHLGQSPTVRAMPNTPSALGEGVVVLCAEGLSPAARALAQSLMQPLGHTPWLEDESLMDAAAAISGCGPAYVFLFAHALAQAGQKAGLPAPLAQELALKTLSGSAALAAQSAATLPELWAQVASPGGMTEAALARLSAAPGLPELMQQAVAAAVSRAAELAKK